jgi:hypothetical protein
MRRSDSPQIKRNPQVNDDSLPFPPADEARRNLPQCSPRIFLFIFILIFLSPKILKKVSLALEFFSASGAEDRLRRVASLRMKMKMSPLLGTG